MQGILVDINALLDQLDLSIQSAAAVQASGNRKNIFGFKFIVRKSQHEGFVMSETVFICVKYNTESYA